MKKAVLLSVWGAVLYILLGAIAPPGHTTQKMPFRPNVIPGFLQIFGSWARFLL